MPTTTLLMSGNRTSVELVESEGRRWVVKTLLPFANVGPERRQLGREARLSRIARRPGVAAALDEVGEGEELSSFRREYVDGPTLSERLRNEGAFSPEKALVVLSRLLKLLAELHEEVDSGGLIHGDVTPTNIYLLKSGEVVLNDFGLARLTSEGPPASDEFLRGSPNFLAPELFRDVAPSPKSDVYQAGRVLCEMLEPSKGHSALEKIPGLFRARLKAMLSDSPEERPSARILAHELRI